MTYRRAAFATFRVGFGGGRPSDVILQIRVRCWLARVACLIERRDTPQAPAGQSTEPNGG